MTEIKVEAGRGGSYGDLSISVELPVLTGSDKQIDWANKIRIETSRAALAKLVESPAAVARINADPRKAALLESLAAVVAGRISAKQWIDAKGDAMGLLRAAAQRLATA